MKWNYDKIYSLRRVYLNIDEEQLFRVAKQIMEDEKPYLKCHLTLDELAERINVSRNTLSRTINLYAKVRFTTWLTMYRVAEVEQLAMMKENQATPLKKLAKQAGFASRTSFYRGFKNMRGIAPEEWRKKEFCE